MLEELGEKNLKAISKKMVQAVLESETPTQAYNAIRDIIGEKPTDKTEIEAKHTVVENIKMDGEDLDLGFDKT